jgi:hypothetical protein
MRLASSKRVLTPAALDRLREAGIPIDDPVAGPARGTLQRLDDPKGGMDAMNTFRQHIPAFVDARRGEVRAERHERLGLAPC